MKTEPPPRDNPEALIESMQAYYARRAPVYEASMGYDRAEVVRSLQPIITMLCDAMRDRAVLEIACGPGFWAQFVATTARSVLATDFNESTLTIARQKALDAQRVRFIRADAYDLSEIDGVFTGAFAVDWLAHVPRSRLSSFLDGLHARLAPGARVMFCDQTPGPSSETTLRDSEGNHLQERSLADGSQYHVIKHFFSDDEFRRVFKAHTDALRIERLPEARRVVVSYESGNRMHAPAGD